MKPRSAVDYFLVACYVGIFSIHAIFLKDSLTAFGKSGMDSRCYSPAMFVAQSELLKGLLSFVFLLAENNFRMYSTKSMINSLKARDWRQVMKNVLI